MKPIVADTDDRRWKAVCERDTRADGQFVFAVLTTGVCCRPSCRSRRARRENVRFFADVAAAVAAGFRPCKRCQPDKDSPQQQRIDKVAQACRLLEQEAPLTLEALACELAVSPFHFHRLFKSVTGMTPKAAAGVARATPAGGAGAGKPVTRAALAAGFPDSSSYYRQADAALGMTASQFRRGGAATVVTGRRATVRWAAAWWRKVNAASALCCRVITMLLCSTICVSAFPAPSCVRATLSFVVRWRRFSPTSTTAGGRCRCRWICGAPRSSCRSGRRCGRSRRGRPEATAGGRAYWPAAGGKSRGRRLRGEFTGGDRSLPSGGA